MWVIVSEEYCVVQCGPTYYVCRRIAGGKLDCLRECPSYQEAEQAYRQLRGGV
ncbi:MAG TPA: hypothetical protein VFB38_18960 [Chthonomonadaceae bacterium]|nr:hypothetical protein [Chthonomonadaceae bacterium]